MLVVGVALLVPFLRTAVLSAGSAASRSISAPGRAEGWGIVALTQGGLGRVLLLLLDDDLGHPGCHEAGGQVAQSEKSYYAAYKEFRHDASAVNDLCTIRVLALRLHIPARDVVSNRDFNGMIWGLKHCPCFTDILLTALHCSRRMR